MEYLQTKPLWASKTIWINFILAGAAFFPAVQAHITPEKIAAIFTVINTVMRFISKDKITVSGE